MLIDSTMTETFHMCAQTKMGIRYVSLDLVVVCSIQMIYFGNKRGYLTSASSNVRNRRVHGKSIGGNDS